MRERQKSVVYPQNALSHVPASPLPFPASASSNIIATVLMLPHDGPGGACSRAGTEEEAAARKACWRSRHMDASCWKEPALILVRQAACNRACTRQAQGFVGLAGAESHHTHRHGMVDGRGRDGMKQSPQTTAVLTGPFVSSWLFARANHGLTSHAISQQ